MIQAAIARLEGCAPRGIWMVPVCAGLFNIWRGEPYPDAHAWNAWGVFGIVIALAAFRLASREAVSTGLLLLIGCIAVVMATPDGEASNMARVFIGGLMLTAAIAATAEGGDRPFDWALIFGLWSEVIVWTLGNAERGTFGSDVAVSAIGQAYGPWMHPLQLVAIALAYLADWTWRRTRLA